MKWLKDELKKLAQENREDYQKFLDFATGRRRRQLEKRLREMRQEMQRRREVRA